ncbi:hypothetical protein BVRB_5g110190 [Beta vulgaris subsp. vulgaris]|uniref:HAT C-terminal dimerisation domain-containing protein n=1 Tax=Beta vulgaris subsp. vulgaris TaxID=3555 RepID=A0A0J8CBN0_BETVV|nr:hypothetical protein BVRB_5g110190 [Beta vulgaris subsp. vulgaris]
MAFEMKQKFDKYWLNSTEDDYGTLFAFAMILDPRCKLQVLKFCYKKLYGDEQRAMTKINDVRLKLELFFEEYTQDTNISSATRIPTTSTTNKKRPFDYLDEYEEEDAINSFRRKIQLHTYLEDEKLDRKMQLDILSFWKENEHRYGKLSHLARDILTVPLTTVASESTFSIGGRVLNKWRSSYLPENVEALITSRSWLYGFQADEESEYVGCDVDWTSTKSVAQ